jgi:hypothetical protein
MSLEAWTGLCFVAVPLEDLEGSCAAKLTRKWLAFGLRTAQGGTSAPAWPAHPLAQPQRETRPTHSDLSILASNTFTSTHYPLPISIEYTQGRALRETNLCAFIHIRDTLRQLPHTRIPHL